MQVTVRDTLTPALEDLQTRIRDRRGALEAIGLYIVSVTKRAHTDASLRPHTWPARKDGKASTLQRSTTMRRMWHVSAVTNESVTVSNPMPYAAHHHYGAQSKPHIIRARKKKGLKFTIGGVTIVRRSVKHPGSTIPKRRVMPVEDDGSLTPHAAGGVVDIITRRIMRGA